MLGTSIGSAQRPAGPFILNTARPISNISCNLGVQMPRQRTYNGSARHVITHASAASDLGIESVGDARPAVEEAIQAALNNCLTETDLGIGRKYRVRSSFGVDENCILFMRE